MLIALDPIDDKLPQIIKNSNLNPDMSHAMLGLLSNLVAASIDVTAVITSTTTIFGFDISRKFLIFENLKWLLACKRFHYSIIIS